jgi:dihydropyrimidine dehydrogenase (NADP+)
VQNQDFSVINDYNSALKAMLYMKSRDDLQKWKGQSEPTPKHQMGKAQLVDSQGGKLPYFGHFQKQRQSLQAEITAPGNEAAVKTMDTVHAIASNRPTPAPVHAVPTINQVIGRSLDQIGRWDQLSQSEQVVAVVDPDLCINCGKCYMTCNDSGYQAIDFDATTHIPEITEDCTGCTLCVSVCPVVDCIEMVPRDGPYIPKRGAPFLDSIVEA